MRRLERSKLSSITPGDKERSAEFRTNMLASDSQLLLSRVLIMHHHRQFHDHNLVIAIVIVNIFINLMLSNLPAMLLILELALENGTSGDPCFLA